MKILCIPMAYRGFLMLEAVLPEHDHIGLLIDIPGKKIYLNRAAREGANVVQVRFSRTENQPEQSPLLRRR